MHIAIGMQVTDTFMISIGRNLGQPHDLIAISLDRIDKTIFLPVLNQCGINADMRYRDPSVIPDGFKKYRYRHECFHKKLSL